MGGSHLDGLDPIAGIEGILPDFRDTIGDDDFLRCGVSVEGTGAQFFDTVGKDRVPAADHQRVGLRLDDRIAVQP